MPADSHRYDDTHTALWRRPPASKGLLRLWEGAGDARLPSARMRRRTRPRFPVCLYGRSARDRSVFGNHISVVRAHKGRGEILSYD